MIVPCPHCTKPSKLDSDRLPDGPAAYPCPHCKQKVVVDKRKLLEQQQAAAQVPARPGQAAAAPPSPAEPVTLASTAPSNLKHLRLPKEATFPPGLILGEDAEAVAEIRKMMAGLGSELDAVESSDAAKKMILNEQRDLCIYVAGDIPESGHPPLAPLIGLPPNSRRRLFLVLVANNVQTLDGTAAFLHQVNMTLARADVPQIAIALHAGLGYHERIYKPYFDAVKAKGAVQ